MADVIAQLKKFQKDLQEYADDLKNGKYIQQVASECVAAIADDVDTIFETYVDQYYFAYPPRYYKRTFSLYDFYTISAGGTTIRWDIHMEGAGEHRVGNDYIFDYMWEQGYHGGADDGPEDAAGNPHPGYMAWRKYPPDRFVKGNNGQKPWQLWGNEAVKTAAPSEKIGIDMDRYQHNASNISGHTLLERTRYAFNHVNSRYSIFDWA